MQEKQVETIAHIDFSEIRVPMIAVYKSPEDFPGLCVARIFDMDKPTDTILVKETIQELEEDIRMNTGMVFLKRGAEDVPCLVGVWL